QKRVTRPMDKARILPVRSQTRPVRSAAPVFGFFDCGAVVYLEEQSVWTPQEFAVEALDEREQQPSTAALVLLDALFKPVSYDAEAIQILTWPHDPGRFHPIGPHIENTL